MIFWTRLDNGCPRKDATDMKAKMGVLTLIL
jgi:hypothetical protein